MPAPTDETQASNPESNVTLSSLPYAIFSIGDQRFGLSTEYVREMFLLPHVTPIPNTPDYVRGLINLRGKIVNLIDLRIFIGMAPLFEDIEATVAELKQRKQDHLEWLDTLEQCAESGEEFKLGRDANQCAFGKWYRNYQPSNVTLQIELKKFDKPHKAIHALADETLGMLNNGDKQGALNLIEHRRTNDLATMLALFDNLIRMLNETNREMVIVYQHEENMLAFSVDEIISVERVPLERIESSEDVNKHHEMPLRGTIARREKTGDVITLITPDAIKIAANV